jgi:hypothetical protein
MIRASSGGLPGSLRPLPALLVLLLAWGAPPLASQVPDDPPPPPQVPEDAPPPPEDPDDDVLDPGPPTPIEIRNLPLRPPRTPAGWETGTWVWGQDELRSTRALTLLELLEEIPGVLPLRGGDHGQPRIATAFGLGAGRVRVFRDGIEVPPLDGGAVDLSRVGLTGLERVVVERGPGELRVDLLPLRFEDPRPFTHLEVGTGDLNTNLFRGTFAHPTALGGNIVFSLDRIETEGPFRREPGASFGGHVRHTFFVGARGALAWELRRMTSRRPVEFWAPQQVRRSDLRLEGHRELAPGILALAYAQRSSLTAEPSGPGAGEEPLRLNEEPRSILGLRVSLHRGPGWLEGEVRTHGGAGWPGSAQALRGGFTLDGWGGMAADLEREGWEGGSGTSARVRGWTAPRFGVSLFGEMQGGSRSVPLGAVASPGEDEEGDPPSEPGAGRTEPGFTQGEGFRGGAQWRGGGLSLSVAAVAIRPDSLGPLGFLPDREGAMLPGGSRTGFEAATRIPLDRVMQGLTLSGSAQLWDRETEAWRYLPERIYEGRLGFRRTFLPSGNLEVWADVGVHGRDAMWVPVPAGEGVEPLARVPSQLEWRGRFQVRISSALLFVRWENFTVRQSNQDFPQRLLVPTRLMYGVRWTLWN